MKKRIFIFFLAGIMITALMGLSWFSVKAEQEINTAVNYIKSQDQSSWTTMALAAAGEENIGLDHLKSIPSGQESATAFAKYILALVSVGENPVTFGNENYVEGLRSYYNSENNQFGSEQFINDDIWTILAFGSVGKEYLPEVQQSKQFILDNQNEDGGWSFGLKGSPSSADMTASAIMALIEAGVESNDAVITNAKNYLKSIQNSDGGFPGWTGQSSASSDAWIISAIYKLGEDPTAADWTKDGNNPIEHIKSLQDLEKGFFYDTQGGSGEDSFVASRTSYAIIALSEKTYPIFSSYNSHYLRIEGLDNTICDRYVNGGTALDLVIEAAKLGNFVYSLQYYESFNSFLLTEISNESNWEYRVNNILPMVGADNYYLEPEDEVLWHGVDNLWGNWFLTKIELTKAENLVKIQVKDYNSTANDWQNLEIEGIKVKIGSSEFFTDSQSKIEISQSILADGFYQVFVEAQIIQETGYIRSEKIGLKIGEIPLEHGTGLRVEIEKIEVSPKGEQTVISFSVGPDILDFGKLKPGESNSLDLTITNSETEIYLETEVNGAGIFWDNLEINGIFWQIFSTELKANQNKVLPVQLSIPQNYNGDFGLTEGELTFWAIKK